MLASTVESTRPDNETGLAQALRTVGRRADARSLIIVLSDFLDNPREVIASLSRLAQRGADVIACHVLDPAERSFPFDNWTRFRDSEDATVDLRVDARQLKQVYRENLERHLRILEDGCRGAAIDYLPFSTDMPFRRSLAAYLEARSRRRR